MSGLRREVAKLPALDLLLRAVAIGVLVVLIFVALPILIANAG
jgi:hypothetical protein